VRSASRKRGREVRTDHLPVLAVLLSVCHVGGAVVIGSPQSVSMDPWCGN